MFWQKKEIKEKIPESIEILLSRQIKELSVRVTHCEADTLQNSVMIQNITDKVLRRLKVRQEQTDSMEESENINSNDLYDVLNLKSLGKR